ncbi:hypothetical protein ABZ816_30855 [Actinosynnema sp. NPDC047251]|uniref:hypothetical protein n=1 Tax=Saccharothrix espanaensis TaxID=103731 RepID=UPI001E51FFBC|nr:hypothetical protein [Saccharothrix espanaensis]
MSVTVHRTDGSQIAGTAVAPAGSFFGYPVRLGTYQVRVPAGARNVQILDLSPGSHSVIVNTC